MISTHDGHMSTVPGLGVRGSSGVTSVKNETGVKYSLSRTARLMWQRVDKYL